MPLQATSGAASYDAFGGGAAAVIPYIEDVFSTWLYTGTGISVNNTITNGIDLAGKGGLVWTKGRSVATSHALNDTVRGFSNYLQSQTTNAQNGSLLTMTANSNGYTINDSNGSWNGNGDTFASWTFRKQPKFFDVQTWTGSGANRTIAHNLGSVPGCIMVKRTDTTADWQVYHRSLANTEYLVLNSTAAKATGATRWNSTRPTSTVFSIGTDATVNASGGTYVAYVFAHDAGGFGLTGTDNVISCGSYTGNFSVTGPTITLGYEPQWVLIKNTTDTGFNWSITDNMRGFTTNSSGGTTVQLFPNTSGAEANFFYVQPKATGFQITDTSGIVNASGSTYIYIAIRRGPMKVPSTGTSVFSPNTSSATTGTQITTNFPVDLQIARIRTGASSSRVFDRLRGVPSTTTETSQMLQINTDAELTDTDKTRLWDNTSFQMPSGWAGSSTIFLNFKRSPSVFDVVCYTGTGSNTTIAHNLGAVPELMIVKQRGSTSAWAVYASAIGAANYLTLNATTASGAGATLWNSTTPTSSVFSIGTAASVNTSAGTYVAYLFATCAGVSKVGSYTGTATTKQIDCGFTAGARFVLIKRTDSTGDWYVWDTARGIIAGNDPYLLLNSTAAEVTSTDYVDTYSAGFELSSTAPAAINASGGTFIFLAIA